MEPITSLNDPLPEEEAAEPTEERPDYRRLFWLAAFILLAILALWLRLYQLQVVHGEDYREQADNNRFREVTIPPPRGVIYDRHRVVLARNRPSYSVGIVPADLPDPAQRAIVLQRLAAIVHVAPGSLRLDDRVGVGSQFSFVELVANVPEDVAFAVEERHRELPGVSVRLQPSREYPLGASAAPVLGYVGRISEAQYRRLKDDEVHRYGPNDIVGQSGVERTFEATLRGTPGEEQIEVDATGREVRTLHVASPSSGQNLVLTIDAGLQKFAAEVLAAGIERYHTASVVALDPQSGQVLALVNQPSYDDNLFARGITDADYQKLIDDPRHPLLNAAVSAAYPPGATFHVITALAGLETGVITDSTKLDCPGFITVPNRFDPTVGTRLADARALGLQDPVSALADSCNVFFYQVGGGEPNGKWAGVGIEGLAHFAQLAGLGEPTGIDLVEEAAGLVPSVRWKRQELKQEWVPMDTYQTSVGTGYLQATPIQMANVAAAIANGGTLYRPQLVLETTEANGTVTNRFAPEVIRRLPVKPQYVDLVRKGMIAATSTGQTEAGTRFDGIAKLASVPGWTTAGVVGTVEFGVPDAAGNLPTHAWFVGFAPAEHPQIALAVFLERGSGSEDAARVAQQIFSYYHKLSLAEGH